MILRNLAEAEPKGLLPTLNASTLGPLISAPWFVRLCWATHGWAEVLSYLAMFCVVASCSPNCSYSHLEHDLAN